MTFIDDATLPSVGDVTTYIVLSILSLVCTYRSFVLGNTKLHYQHLPVVRYLFPIACFISALENACLAATKPILVSLDDENENGGTDVFVQALYVLQSFIVPILLVVMFEVTYLVHKRRSVNFCGIYFDRGQRIKIIGNRVRSFIMRNFMRMLGMVLLIIGVVANFDAVEELKKDPLAGRVGWIGFIKDPRDFEEKYHLFLSLFPTLILTICCLYLSIVLWRYGTNSSMVVHSSYCNPWFSLFFGTLALIGGQLFGEKLYSITSNFGYICLYASLIMLMYEVDKDMEAAEDFTDFLKHVAACGEKCSVKNVMTADEDDGNNIELTEQVERGMANDTATSE